MFARNDAHLSVRIGLWALTAVLVLCIATRPTRADMFATEPTATQPFICSSPTVGSTSGISGFGLFA